MACASVAHDTHARAGLERIFGMQREDDVHGAFGAGGDGLLGVVGGLGERGAEVGKDIAGIGGEGVGLVQLASYAAPAPAADDDPSLRAFYGGGLVTGVSRECWCGRPPTASSVPE